MIMADLILTRLTVVKVFTDGALVSYTNDGETITTITSDVGMSSLRNRGLFNFCCGLRVRDLGFLEIGSDLFHDLRHHFSNKLLDLLLSLKFLHLSELRVLPFVSLFHSNHNELICGSLNHISITLDNLKSDSLLVLQTLHQSLKILITSHINHLSVQVLVLEGDTLRKSIQSHESSSHHSPETQAFQRSLE